MDFSKIRFKDVINPWKHLAFVEGNVRSLFSELGLDEDLRSYYLIAYLYLLSAEEAEVENADVDNIYDKIGLSTDGTGSPSILAFEDEKDRSYAEQVLYRSILCRDCLIAGSCTHCGCTVPENMFSAINYCSDEKWGPMKPYGSWEDFKNKNNIKFKLL